MEHVLINLFEKFFGKDTTLLVGGWLIILFAGICTLVFLFGSTAAIAELFSFLAPHSQPRRVVPTDKPVPWYCRVILTTFSGLALWGGIAMVSAGTGINPDRAAEKIERLQGFIRRDETAKDRPIIAVSFSCKNLHDSDLADLKRYLECLSELRELDLTDTLVTSSGLRHLKSLHQLKKIRVGSIGPVPPGMTGFSEAFTDQSVADLRQALPNAEIEVVRPLTPQDVINGLIRKDFKGRAGGRAFH